MKRLFTLCAASMLAMGASAQTPEKLKIYFDFSWSAQQVVDKVGENL